MGKIHTRVINLKRREDRLLDIGHRLGSAGISWVRQNATDATEVSEADLTARFPINSRAYPLSHVERACADSHLTCWKDFLKSDAEALCVLEDDVRIHPGLSAVLERDDWLTTRHGIVKVDVNSVNPKPVLVSDTELELPPGSEMLLRLWSKSLGAGGYLMHRNVVTKLIAASRPSVPIDHFLFNPIYAPHFREVGVNVIVPPLVFHDHTMSDLQATRSAQEKDARWARTKIWREIANATALPGKVVARCFRGASLRVIAPR